LRSLRSSSLGASPAAASSACVRSPALSGQALPPEETVHARVAGATAHRPAQVICFRSNPCSSSLLANLSPLPGCLHPPRTDMGVRVDARAGDTQQWETMQLIRAQRTGNCMPRYISLGLESIPNAPGASQPQLTEPYESMIGMRSANSGENPMHTGAHRPAPCVCAGGDVPWAAARPRACPFSGTLSNPNLRHHAV
jgi:hypothetical protein